jgi:hypothetical protein
MCYRLAVCALLFAFVAVNATPVNAQNLRPTFRGPLLPVTPQQAPEPAIHSNCTNQCALQANGCTSICPTGAAQTLCAQNCSLQQTSCLQICEGMSR